MTKYHLRQKLKKKLHDKNGSLKSENKSKSLKKDADENTLLIIPDMVPLNHINSTLISVQNDNLHRNQDKNSDRDQERLDFECQSVDLDSFTNSKSVCIENEAEKLDRQATSTLSDEPRLSMSDNDIVQLDANGLFNFNNEFSTVADAIATPNDTIATDNATEAVPVVSKANKDIEAKVGGNSSNGKNASNNKIKFENVVVPGRIVSPSGPRVERRVFDIEQKQIRAGARTALVFSDSEASDIDDNENDKLDVSRQELITLSNLKLDTNIRVLDVSYNHLSDVFWKQEQELMLKSLDLSNNPLNLVAESCFGALQHLIEINVSYTCISSLWPLRLMPTLEIVHAANNSIECVQGLETLNRLREVYLQKNRFETLLSIRALSLCTKLRKLCLAGNAVAKSSRFRATIISILPKAEELDGDLLPHARSMHAKTMIQSVKKHKEISKNQQVLSDIARSMHRKLHIKPKQQVCQVQVPYESQQRSITQLSKPRRFATAQKYSHVDNNDIKHKPKAKPIHHHRMAPDVVAKAASGILDRVRQAKNDKQASPKSSSIKDIDTSTNNFEAKSPREGKILAPPVPVVVKPMRKTSSKNNVDFIQSFTKQAVTPPDEAILQHKRSTTAKVFKDILQQVDFPIFSELFHQLDDSESGFLTMSDWNDTLELVGLALNEQDVEMLLEKYSAHHGTAVDYKTFCFDLSQSYKAEQPKTPTGQRMHTIIQKYYNV